jgi:hypothetical protein
MELKEIGAVSSAKVLGVFYTAIRLIAGLIVAAIGLTGAALGNASDGMNPLLGGLFSVGAIVVLPVLYGIFGVLGGLIFSWLYNVIARLVGGIQVTLQ